MRGTITGLAALAAMTMLLSASAEPVAGSLYVTGKTPIANGGYRMQRMPVDFGALDPSKPENATAVLETLKNTAEKVCAPIGGSFGVGLNDKVQKCRKQAVEDAVATMNMPELTRLASRQ